MADDAGLGVAVDVGLPLPGRGVWVASADVFRLQALELLLRAELVGLEFQSDVSKAGGGGQRQQRNLPFVRVVWHFVVEIKRRSR